MDPNDRNDVDDGNMVQIVGGRQCQHSAWPRPADAVVAFDLSQYTISFVIDVTGRILFMPIPADIGLQIHKQVDDSGTEVYFPTTCRLRPLALPPFLRYTYLIDGVLLFPLRHYSSPSTSVASVFDKYMFEALPTSGAPPPPRLAHMISGCARDGAMIRRTLESLYHPHNQYVGHLDTESSAVELLDMVNYMTGHTVFRQFENVWSLPGLTMVANTLHVAVVLLRKYGDWDLFTNLSASGYPMGTLWSLKLVN